MGAPPGTLRVFAFADSTSVMAEFVVDGQGPYVTPYVLSLSPKTYKVVCTYMGQKQEKEVVIESEKTTDVMFYFTLAPGTLEVRAYADGVEVGASVVIEGVGTYRTPFKVDLKPGTYTLVATYEDQTARTVVTVESGKTTKADFGFTLPPGTLEVVAYYDGVSVPANVYVDTAYLVAPASISLKPGTYRVKASYVGQTQEKVVTIKSKEVVKVEFYFVKPTVKLVVKAVEGGTTDPPSGTYEFKLGTSVTITAYPSPNYVFKHWLVDSSVVSDNPITLVMDKDYVVTPYFEALPPPPPPPPPPPEEVPPPPEAPPKVPTKTVATVFAGLLTIALTKYFMRE